ncbi:MAG: N-acetylgalactosamine-6-sulfatase [Opitutus sp.]|nr:N-acetylgalactosamine-6-sulfatase [Opitutus sp.]
MAASVSGQTPGRDRPPNIVLIVSDDQGFDLGAYGSTQFVTPHLDRMAAEGVRATNFYVTASVCTPSRSGLITGRYPQRNGTYEMITNVNSAMSVAEYAISPEMTLGLDVREKTIGDVLRTAGYTSAVIGKWDLGQARRFLPLQRGFDFFVGHGNNGIDYYTHERYGAPSLFRGNALSSADRGTYATEIFRREAVGFIRRSRERPFFLYLPFNAPHAASTLGTKDGVKESWQVPEKYLRKYYPDRDPANPETRYAAMISAMDEAIGEVFATLRELRLERTTLVLFLADNGRRGANVDGVRLRGGKASGFEGGLRVPFIAWWPGVIPGGRVIPDFLTALEILPTLAAVGGAGAPDVHLDGFNLLPVLLGKMPSPRREMFWDWPRAYQAARVDHFKWVSYVPLANRDNVPPKEELFDLSVDPGEQHNLASEKPELLARLRSRFASWKAEMDAAEPRGPFRNY